MAKKYRVKYAFGTPEIYNQHKNNGTLDEYTVYFIADKDEDLGTIYRGGIKIGTSKASELIFDKDCVITLAQASDKGDTDLTLTIERGTSLVKAISDLYVKEYNDTDRFREDITVLAGVDCTEDSTGVHPTKSVREIANEAILDKTEDGTLYSKDAVDDTFFRKDEIDSLQAIADILADPEKMEQLVNAAEQITTALEPYYTKEEIDAILLGKDNKNIVQTYDTFDDFPAPEDANINVIYVDDEENVMYRMALNQAGDKREYVEISGGGSGASSDIKLETGITLKGGKSTISVAKGNSLTIEYIFSSAITMMQYDKKLDNGDGTYGGFKKIQQQTGTTATATYFLDGIQFDSGKISQSNYNAEDDTQNVYNSFTIAASRFTASSHDLKIVATDESGNSATADIRIEIVSATITSSYVVTPTNLQTDIEIPVTVTSTKDAVLYYSIDGENAIKVQDVPVGSPVIRVRVPAEGRAHGYHTVKIWATVYIEESSTTISTRILTYDVIWYDSSNKTPIITTAIDIAKKDDTYSIVQYNYATLTYQVYPASTVDLIVTNAETGDEHIVNTLSVDTIAKSWAYTFDTVGVYELYIKVHYGESETLTSEKYAVTVEKSEISMDATPGAVLYFTAKNRSNNEVNPAQWHAEIGDIDAILEGFLWNDNSGWHSKGATTSLRVAAGARCTIPYTPFGGTVGDKITTGQVFEIDFATSSLTDSTAEVVKCYSETDKSGIIITATGAYFSSTDFNLTSNGDARIFVPFKEGDRVRLSFVITPYASDEEGHSDTDDEAYVDLWNGSSYSSQNTIKNGWWRFVKIYINGVCSGVYNYTNTFKQSVPSSIVIGSDKATIDVYSIRCYDTVLYDRAIVNNFIADTQDPDEKLKLFKRNNILNEAGTDVEPSAIRRLMPCLFVTCETDATASGIVNNEHILPTNKSDKRGVTVFFDCDGLDDDARKYYNFCHTFVAFNVQWAVQGTSSQYYPRRNWKGTFKPEKKFKEDYIKTSTGSKPTYIFVDTPWEETIKDGRGARAQYANKYKDNYTNKYQLKDFSEKFSGVSDSNRTIDEISTIPAKKFCMKADFAESSGTHNTGFAKYVDYILKTLGDDYLTPPQKAQYNKNRRMTDVTFRTSVDGYPIAMFWRPTFEDNWEFYGKFNFNIDKGAESVFGFIDYDDGGLTSSDINPMTGQPFVQFDEDYYDSASQEDRISYEPPVECWEFTNNSTDLCKFRNVTPTSFTEKTKDADGVTELPAWLGSFEVRHPDDDTLIEEDYGTGLKKPTHWAAFSEWVSSTDRSGVHNYNKDLPVPTSWSGTYDELIAGATEKETFGEYDGKLVDGELVPTQGESEGEPALDINRRYILLPQVQDPGDGTWSPDISYTYYGYIVHYNSADSKWYDESKKIDAWVEDGEYVEEDSAVDYAKTYWISSLEDSQYGKVYKYNTNTSSWDNIASISAYALPSPVTYNMVTYQYDTAEYRFAKFKAELSQHMNIPMTTAYYVLTEFFCCADQRAKNMMFASWGYEPGQDKVKPAAAFTDEAAADAAGYKPVYSYAIGNTLAAPNAYVFSNSANNIILGADSKTIVINEIDPNNKKMEFYNVTDSEISLAGYVLKGVDETNASRDDWQFPSNAVIPAHGFYTIEFKTNDTVNGPTYGLSPKKAWSFTLEDPDGTVLDTVTNDLHTDGITSFAGSWGRETDGGDKWVEFKTPSIGQTNSLKFVDHVCINEVYPNAISSEYPTQKGIELYNPTNDDVNLAGWKLNKGDVICSTFTVDNNGKETQYDGVDDSSNNKTTTFTSAAVIPSHGYFVVKFNDGKTADTMPGGLSPNSGFALKLYDSADTLIDEVDNSSIIAYAEAPDGAEYKIGTDLATDSSVYVVNKDYVALKGSSADHTEYRSWGRILDGVNIWKVFDTGTPNQDNSTDMSPKYSTTDLLDITTYICHGNEISGLIYNNDKSGFIAVSDTGVIYDITLDGEVTEKPIENYDPNIRFLGVSPTTGKTWKRGLSKKDDEDVTGNVPDVIPNTDLEAITRDNDGNIYVMSEFRTLQIESATPADSAPVYAYIYKLNGNMLDIVAKLDTDMSMEGFCYYKDNLFFVGSQKNSKIYLADFTDASADSTIALKPFADFSQYVSEIADIAYDGENIWILDSKEKSISKIAISPDGLSGTFAEKFIIKFKEPTSEDPTPGGNNPEGLLVDKEQNIFWVCCDDDFTSSPMLNNYKNLFKVAMDNSHYIPDIPAAADPGDPITDHVVLNEFDGGTKKIELYNPTDTEIDLGGMWLVKTPQDDSFNDEIAVTESNLVPSYDTWQFPTGSTISPKGFFVVTCGKTSESDGGPTFGLSFKDVSKKFDMYLMTDASALRNAVGAQVVDMSKVIDHVDNYTNPVVIPGNNGTFGRIKDGYSNLCVFKSPGTIGSANSNGEIESVVKPGGSDVPPTVSNKTVLYWVPKDAEYIYYPIFYDNDTILSLDNTGHIKFNPNVESTDRVGTGYAFNGTESVLWLNFKDAFDTEIRATYVNMRSKGGLTYANCMKYFNESQSDQWPENVYNIDGKFKYVIPATKGYIDYSTQDPTTGNYGVRRRVASYLYECQGSREEHRKWWLNNRFTYMDSRYFAGEFAEDYATIRLYTPSVWKGIAPSSTFKLTPYADMYLRVMFGQIVSTLRAEKNKTYDIIPSDPNLRFNDTETIIYGASNILSFGDMTNKYAGSVAIDKASKITDIILGADSPYYNENITGAGLTIGAGNSTLKNIDLRGCTKLTRVDGLNQITSIEKIHAERTGITSFDFSTDGVNLNEIHYPETITDIKLVNAKNITFNNIDIPNYTNIKSVWIENCAKLMEDSWKLINNILSIPKSSLTAVRVVGFTWTITTLAAFENWKKLIKLAGISEKGIQEYSVPYLSGTANIGGEVIVSKGYKEGIESMFAEAGGLKVNIPAANIADMTGIKIVIPENASYSNNLLTVVPGVEYTFGISYLPDDFVLDSDKGVDWKIDGQKDRERVKIIKQSPDSITIKYEGSTDGNSLYILSAASSKNPSFVNTITFNPSATLTSIVITDLNGVEISPSEEISINENETLRYNVKFLPLGTPDDEILEPTVIGGEYLSASYDTTLKQLAITGKDVSTTSTASVVIESSTVPSIRARMQFKIKNIVSRIIQLKDDDGNLIGGYASVSYVDPKTREEVTRNIPTDSGEIILRADSEYGGHELKITADAYDGNRLHYSIPPALISPAFNTEDARNDIYHTITFHKPVIAKFYVKNSNNYITDRYIKISSRENEELRNMSEPPFNNVIGGQANPDQPIEIELLSYSTHHITIQEVDEHGSPILNNTKYTTFSTVYTIAGQDVEYNISLSRDYLTDVNDDSQLKMTVRTGKAAGYTVVRLYVATTGPIVINWGDGSSTNVESTGSEVEIKYHNYDGDVYETEFDITVDKNTENIKWFHVIQPTANTMLPCIGSAMSPSGFNTTWTNNDSGAGLVAYESSGMAAFISPPKFKFDNKSYSVFACVGNIYKNCVAMTSADSLFENTALQQISNIPLFEKCVNIKTFNSTFKNSDITVIPGTFFMNNINAYSFEETFSGCRSLTTIGSSESIDFLNPKDGIEIVSLKNMFKNCSTLYSEVPGFWKTFYGCSFTVFTPQKTFEGCSNVSNIGNIPVEWGGPAPTYHESDEHIRLEYLSFTAFGDSNIAKSGPGILPKIETNVYPKGHYRYLFDFNMYGQWYEPIPLFSSGYTSDEESLSEDSLVSATDFIRGGSEDGTSHGWTGYLLYRVGSKADTNWYAAGTVDSYIAAKVFDENAGDGYGGSVTRTPDPALDNPWPGKDRVMLDISYTNDGLVYIYPYGKEDAKHEYKLWYWNGPGTAQWEANLPLRFLLPYNKHPLYYTNNTGVETTFKHSGFIAIRELKVFDDTADKKLVADIYPVYGKYEEVWNVYLYNDITGDYYPIEDLPADEFRKLHFYPKKQNDTI